MTMNKVTIRFYTDYKSPFAYLTQSAAYELAAIDGVEVRWLPYTLRIAEYLDSVAERSAHNWRKVRYAYMDARRLANRRGLLVRAPQKVFDGYYASAGMLYAQRKGFFRKYNDLVFERFWKRELDIDSLDTMAGLIRALGGDADEYAGYAAGSAREEHDRIVEEAEQQGVFGVPTFVLEGELFWGTDRIPLLRERLDALLACGSEKTA